MKNLFVIPSKEDLKNAHMARSELCLKHSVYYKEKDVMSRDDAHRWLEDYKTMAFRYLMCVEGVENWELNPALRFIVAMSQLSRAMAHYYRAVNCSNGVEVSASQYLTMHWHSVRSVSQKYDDVYAEEFSHLFADSAKSLELGMSHLSDLVDKPAEVPSPAASAV